MSDIFKKLYNSDGTVDYIFNQKEFCKTIFNFLSNPLIQYIEEFCKVQNTNNVFIIGTKENLSKYVDLIKDYFTVSKGIKTSFKYVPENILEDKNKIIVVNENEINMKPLKFKYNFDLTNRWDYDTVDVVKKIIMEED